MYSKKKLKKEIKLLKCRIANSEKRLYFCGSHDWKKVGFRYAPLTNHLDLDIICTYKCSRCGKTRETIE